MTEKTLGPEHPQVARTLAGYAALLRATKRKNEASKLGAACQGHCLEPWL